MVPYKNSGHTQLAMFSFRRNKKVSQKKIQVIRRRRADGIHPLVVFFLQFVILGRCGLVPPVLRQHLLLLSLQNLLQLLQLCLLLQQLVIPVYTI